MQVDRSGVYWFLANAVGTREDWTTVRSRFASGFQVSDSDLDITATTTETLEDESRLVWSVVSGQLVCRDHLYIIKCGGSQFGIMNIPSEQSIYCCNLLTAKNRMKNAGHIEQCGMDI